MHLLKNGHPAHAFTDEDRRKAAAVTNAICREKRALFEQLRLNEEIERMLAADRARRARKADSLHALAHALRVPTQRAPHVLLVGDVVVGAPHPAHENAPFPNATPLRPPRERGICFPAGEQWCSAADSC
jgi:hypothetical protein